MKTLLPPLILGLVLLLSACSTELSSIPTETPTSEPVSEAEQLDAQLELAAISAEESMVVEEGDEVSVTLYAGDPENDGTELATDTFIKGEEQLREVVKALHENHPEADYLVISANGESRIVSFAEAKRHSKRRAVNAILSNLEDGTEVGLALYNGNPNTDGVEVVSTSYLVGETSFQKSLRSLIADATDQEVTHIKITVTDESIVSPLPKKLTTDLASLLAGLSEGDEVSITLYNGDPANGGEQLVSASYIVGTGYFQASLKALRKNAGRGTHSHIVVATGDQSVTIALKQKGSDRN